VPISFAWHFGALGIPRNDDWAYAFAAFHVADSAKVNGYTWAGMNLVGQLVLSVPVVKLFGDRIAALQMEVATLGVVGLVATFDLARQLLNPRRALFAAVLVAALPMWASLSASYMTDVPAFAFATACLALGARGVTRHAIRPGYFGASLAIGFLAFTIRENAIVAPLAVSAAATWVTAGRPRKQLFPIVAAIASLIASAGLFYAWRRNLPGFLNVTPRLPTLSRVGLAALESGQSLVLIGLLASPAVVLADPRRLLRIAWGRARRTTLTAGLTTAGIFTVAMLRTGASAVLVPGDYFLPNGTLGSDGLKGLRPDLIPRSVVAVLAIVGASALVVLVCAAAASVTNGVAHFRNQRQSAASPPLVVVTLATIAYAIACVVPVVLGYTFLFDRYLLPIIPLVAILALRSGGPAVAISRRIRIAGCTALAALAALGAVYGANSAAFDGTKWRVASQAVAVAGDPKLIDGGHVWNDYHAGKHIQGHLRSPCIVLRAERHPGVGEVGIVGVGRVWGVNGTQVWVVARQTHPC